MNSERQSDFQQSVDMASKTCQTHPLLASLFQIDFWMLAKGGVGEGTEAH